MLAICCTPVSAIYTIHAHRYARIDGWFRLTKKKGEREKRIYAWRMLIDKPLLKDGLVPWIAITWPQLTD
jgi:hypothetical protein